MFSGKTLADCNHALGDCAFLLFCDLVMLGMIIPDYIDGCYKFAIFWVFIWALTLGVLLVSTTQIVNKATQLLIEKVDEPKKLP